MKNLKQSLYVAMGVFAGSMISFWVQLYLSERMMHSLMSGNLF